ncbi:MAG: O-antigen ligase family protein [Clostridia bacterium]|nr:O-antigen ligase family protein [Clostridia bacterium]
MFFDYELLYLHMFTSAALLVFLFTRPRAELRLTNNIMDYAGLGLFVAYLLSSFVAINARDGVGEVLKVANYFLIYVMVAYSVRNFTDLNRILLVLYISGIGVAVRGFGAAYGIWEYNGAFADGMINSTLQYHNATAVFLVATVILGTYLVARLDNIWLKMAVGAGNYLAFMAMLGAVSRGAMLVFLIVLVPLIIGLPKGYRIQGIFNVILLFVSFYLTSKQVLVFTPDISNATHLSWLFAGMAVSAAGQLGIQYLSSLSIWNNRRVILGGSVVVLVALVIVGTAFSSKIMPENVVERFKNISFQIHSVQERFTFYKDSVKLVADNPVLGVGGGGWNAIYRKYQSYNYNSTEVHNHFLQTWVEAGTLGFIFFIGLWGGFFYSLVRVYRKTDDMENKAFVWTVGMAALAIGLHSSIDFSLSLGSVSILLWALFGLVRGAERTSVEDGPVGSQILGGTAVKVVVSIIAVGFFFFSAILSSADTYVKRGQEASYRGDLAGTISAFEDAADADWFTADYAMELSRLYLAQVMQTRNPQDLDKALANAQRGVKLNSGNVQGYWNLAQVYFARGLPEEAAKAAEDAQKLIPLRQEGYDELVKIYVAAGNELLRQGQRDRAKAMLDKALGVPDMINKKAEEVKDLPIWYPPMLQVTPAIEASLEEARKAM